MKKQSVSKSNLPALRRLSAGAMLCCATSVAPVVAPLLAMLPLAAHAAADDAALNFVGADIESVIKAVGHYTNITFVIDPRVKGTLTVVSEKPVTKSQAFGLLTSALRLQGYAVVSGDGYAKVVPEADAKLQAGPTQVGASQASAKGDQIVSQIFHLNYESAANVVTVLRPLISPNNTINANPGNNTVVVTDYADNVKRLAKIVAALDAPAVADLDVIPVRYAIASDLAAMVNKLMDSGAGAGDTGKVSVLADPRTNSLVLRAPSAARSNLAKSLIAKLDQPTQELGNVHVVYLKNAEAAKLAQTLRSVVSGDTSAPNATGVSGGGQGGQTQGQGQGGQSSNTGGFGGNSSGAGSSGGPTNPLLTGTGQTPGGGGGTAGYIQADSTTNTLIITAPESVYRNLRAVIDMLDVRRAQVYIESLIVEVSSDKASEFGVQWVGATGNENSTYRVGGLQSYSSGGNNIGTLATQLLNKGTSTATTAPALPGAGLTIGVFKQVAGGLGLGALARSLESDGNANVLSTPNMITLDNELATISVGQNVPVLTGQFTTTSGTNNNPFQTIDRKEVGLTLKVRPQISEGGTVKLAIYHETSSVDKTTLTAAAGITINKRVIENNVIADDGQIIVLGGLIEDTEGDGVSKVRGLGDIPVLGNLFKYQNRSRKKTNLMVFLRPVVIRNKEQSTSLASDRYDYMRAQQDAIQPPESILVKDYGQPTLPLLKDGAPVGGTTMARPLPSSPIPLREPGAAEPAKQK
ncbi:general secretion pathway protein D [Janthinobacterium sp. HH01]|uniref:type II secretion system secretin GspD n=1 Tax=Janthinobacterium sp. HH01 TaxID=1198452 RepID=UPI0002AEA3E7|nr:type II secretion system secretin GspD [Janthinobacterium sp. HH01]ELX11968.1 general secretion pathway protein D [Janthinobacterium sp. HH01]